MKFDLLLPPHRKGIGHSGMITGIGHLEEVALAGSSSIVLNFKTIPEQRELPVIIEFFQMKLSPRQVQKIRPIYSQEGFEYSLIDR